MFATIKQIFNPKNRDLQKRILFTLGILFIFKLGTTIIVPGLPKDKVISGDLGFLELMNVMGGGALEQFSIFALGVGPYITASIIVQLLQMDIIPYFSELSKQGYNGRRKLNQITRWLGIAMAFIQGYIYSFAFLGKSVDTIQYLEFSLILTAGTAFLLWLGDQITAKGVGNGISLIIMAGILMSLPSMFKDAFTSLVDLGNTEGMFLGILGFAVFILVYVLIIVGVIYVQEAERRIPIQYANKSSNSFGGKQSYMPFKLNSAGVVPVIFASALISIPGIIAQVIKNDGFKLFVNKYLTFESVPGMLLYVLFIFLFAYFYTYIQIKPEELSDNLNKNGGYIPGIRPGKETKEYISKILNRITFVGAFFLAIIAGLPIVFSLFSNMPSSVTLGGTGLLIVIGVALETYKQIQGSLASRSYTRGRKTIKWKTLS